MKKIRIRPYEYYAVGIFKYGLDSKNINKKLRIRPTSIT
jgi:hypothetical protein